MKYLLKQYKTDSKFKIKHSTKEKQYDRARYNINLI